MRRSSVLSLPLQLVFPVWRVGCHQSGATNSTSPENIRHGMKCFKVIHEVTQHSGRTFSSKGEERKNRFYWSNCKIRRKSFMRSIYDDFLQLAAIGHNPEEKSQLCPSVLTIDIYVHLIRFKQFFSSSSHLFTSWSGGMPVLLACPPADIIIAQ